VLDGMGYKECGAGDRDIYGDCDKTFKFKKPVHEVTAIIVKNIPEAIFDVF
jgi:hypothetical protein